MLRGRTGYERSFGFRESVEPCSRDYEEAQRGGEYSEKPYGGESESKREIELNKNHEKAITRDHIRFPGSNGPKGPYLFGPPPTARPPLLFRM